MTQSIELRASPDLHYLLRLGDTALILAQRLGEWCGHAPVLEEDIALTNMALDLIGQARALLTRAGQLEGCGHDEDQLAFLRDERHYYNVTLVELPRGDFAWTVLRNLFASTWARLLWERLTDSSDAELAAIAAKDCALDFPGAGVIAWHSTHHRSDRCRPLSAFWADASPGRPSSASMTARGNACRNRSTMSGSALTAAHHRWSRAAPAMTQYPRRQDPPPAAGRRAPRDYRRPS